MLSLRSKMPDKADWKAQTLGEPFTYSSRPACLSSEKRRYQGLAELLFYGTPHLPRRSRQSLGRHQPEPMPMFVSEKVTALQSCFYFSIPWLEEQEITCSQTQIHRQTIDFCGPMFHIFVWNTSATRQYTPRPYLVRCSVKTDLIITNGLARIQNVSARGKIKQEMMEGDSSDDVPHYLNHSLTRLKNVSQEILRQVLPGMRHWVTCLKDTFSSNRTSKGWKTSVCQELFKLHR